MAFMRQRSRCGGGSGLMHHTQLKFAIAQGRITASGLGLAIILHSVPRVMLRDACTEGDKEQKRQGIAFVFIATAVVNQAEAINEAWKFHNLRPLHGISKVYRVAVTLYIADI